MPKVTIYTDTWGADWIPHTFLGITDKNGNTIYRGFSPDKTGFWGNGSVKDDFNYKQGKPHEFQHAYEIEISQEQYDALISAIKKSTNEYPFYDLPRGAQCTVWAMTMLQEAGIIDQPLIPDFKKHNDGTLGIIDGFFQTLVYNPYAQMNIFMVKDALDNFLNTVKSYYYGFLGISIYDPLALDLNGDGKIGISPASNGGAYFDHNGDGVSHKSSWINKEDGILAYDRNGNGNIDDGGELFGNFTQIKDKESNQRLAKDGYEALKEFDSNNDGLIDKNDDKFKDLKIWQDANSNGISDEGELKSLDELGIASLSLNHNEVNEDLGGGNTLTLKGSYTKTNGQTMLMGDINFNVDTINSKFKDGAPLSSEDMARANIKGFGLLRDLRSAAALNKELAAALDSYSRLNTKEEQLKALPALIKAWSETAVRSGNSNTAGYEVSLKGVKLPSNVNLGAGSNINVDADGNVINSGNPNAIRLSLTPSQYRALLDSSNSIDESLLKEFESIKYKIKVIDAFTGSKTAELYYISNDDIKAIIKNTNETYDKILNYSYASLLAQTRLKGYADLISLDMIAVPNDTATGGDANTSAKPKYDFRLNFTKVIDKFKEINLSDPKKAFVDLAELLNVLSQSGSNDLSGLGTVFYDFMNVAIKNGTFEQYKELLITSSDQNSYIIFPNTKSDSIRGTDKTDIIYAGSGNDKVGAWNGNDVVYGEAGDDELYGGEGNDKLYGGEGNDRIIGGVGSDVLNGDEGDDALYGESGNDILEGGAGNDYLEGGNGDDTYIFGRGDGADTIYDNYSNNTIKFKEGINKEDVTFVVVDSNLSIKYGDSDAITINGYKNSNSYQIEKIELKNGSFITNSQINKIVQDINAYASDNGIVGIGHDVIRNDQNMMNLVMSGWNS